MPVPNSCVRRALAFTVGALMFAGPLSSAPARAAETPAALEEGLPLVERILPEDYRGAGQVTAIAITSDGGLVFATVAAVFLYDRHTYTRIAVPATSATAVACDTRGGLWTCGDSMVGTIENDPTTGEPHFVSRLEQLPASAREIGNLRDLAAGGDGAMFALSDRGVARFGPGGRARWLPLPGDNSSQILARGDRVVHASNPTGLSLLEGDSIRRLTPLDALPARFVALLPGAPDHVRVLTYGGGLFDCALATGRMEAQPTPVDALMHAHPPSGAYALDDGRFALILAEGGLMLVDADWTHARILNKGHGLGSNRIGACASDHEGGLWLATYNGLTRLQVAPGVSVFDERSGFTANGVWGFARQDGVFYAGGVEGLLRLVPADPGSGSPARFTPDPRSPGPVYSLLSLEAGLLVGTARSVTVLPREGPARLLVKTESFVQGLAASRHDPAVVFALSDHGLFVFRQTAEGLVSAGRLRSDFAFWSVAEESDGTLWCATRSNGIVGVTPPADGDWNHAALALFPLGTAGLPATNGWTAAYNAFGEIQFLADDGTHRWEPASQSFPIDQRLALDGRHDVRNFPVVTDAQGRAWTSPWHGLAACSRPLGWFDPARVWHDAPSVASAAVGFFGSGRMLLDSGNPEILWAKGNGALVRLDLAALLAAPPPAGWHPAIRSVRAAGRTWSLAAAIAPAFPFSHEPIVFRFSAPRHAPGSGVRYRTRLLGFDAAWSAPDTAVERTFTNLSGGPFTFEVQALDAGGHESPLARYTFAVTPPWHRRPAAFVLYALAALGAVFAFIRWRLRSAARERARLEQLIAMRTSELAVARDAAESASRAKSAFLASMSHELRTPLNGVLGYAQILQDDRRLAPDQRERLRIVQQSGEHLLHMINDVLDLAKIEAGKLTLHSAPFALGDLLRDIAAAHAPTAAAKRLAFNAELAPDLPAWVEADAQKLRQILDNLIGNAVKFTAAGSVTLGVRCTVGDQIAFAVLDTGPGISAADQRRLFQAFEQAAPDHATSTGSGLGLAISRALVERFGGTLTLDSAPGRGSTFAFTLALPAVQPGAATTAAGRRIVGYSGRPLRALIVDDHEINRRLLAEMLAPLGFVCAEYASPAEALTRLADGAEPWPEVAIIDLRMPEIDGLELTRRLRALPLGPKLKILLTSASVIAFDPADGTRAGCDDFLPKPFRTADLLDKLGRLLGLTWRESDSASPFPAATASAAPLPDSVRAVLHEALATGDLEAFTAELARHRGDHPAAAGRLDELAVAAASFQLARLRQLLE